MIAYEVTITMSRPFGGKSGCSNWCSQGTPAPPKCQKQNAVPLYEICGTCTFGEGLLSRQGRPSTHAKEEVGHGTNVLLILFRGYSMVHVRVGYRERGVAFCEILCRVWC